MARRRLNKKVALIGSTAFVILALAAVLVILQLSRDPAQYIANGDAARIAQDYETARQCYLEALGGLHDPEQKLDVYFKLADVFQALGDWPRVLGCWEQIITIEPHDLKARLGQLKYYYIMADSLDVIGQNVGTYWNDVSTQATEVIAIADADSVVERPKAEWEPDFGDAEPDRWDGGIRSLGAYLYFVRGRAALELARMGATGDPTQLLNEAKSDLQKAKDLDPVRAEIYRCLAAAFLEDSAIAESRGNQDLSDAAAQEADDILAEAVKVVGDQPEPYINRLSRRLLQAQRKGVSETRRTMEALEPEYRDLMTRFASSSQVFSSAAEFFAFYAAYLPTDLGAEKLDLAIGAIDKARSLDPNHVRYARMAAGLYYRRFSLYGDQTSLRRAIDLAEAALELPEATDSPGPRHYAKQSNRFSLCAQLATFYLEQTLNSGGSARVDRALLAKAEKAVHEIEQIQGSEDNPQVVKWQGMLALARGDRGEAVRLLYSAYEKIKAAARVRGDEDAFLSYTLAELFRPTSEIGAVIEFLGSALGAGIVHTKPEAMLDYGRALLDVGSDDVALSVVNSFEERFGANQRSRTLRIETLLAKGHMTEAEEAIARLDAADPNTLKLRLALSRAQAKQVQDAIQRATVTSEAQAVGPLKMQLRDCRRSEADLVNRLLDAAASAVDEDDLRMLCEALIAQRNVDLAGVVVGKYLSTAPDSLAARFYQKLLAEPDPVACSESRRREIHTEVVNGLADPVERATEMGFLYQEEGRLDEAVAQWRKVLALAGPRATRQPAYLSSENADPRLVAVGQVFDIARHRQDWRLAEEMVRTVEAEDLDDCQGHLFAGRLALARGQHEEALKHLNECLRLRPVFSYGYMLRGNVQAALGNERASVEDTRQASSFNPTDPLVAKALANALLVRNSRLGDSVSSDQRRETELALERAIQANPKDVQLLGIYAEFISETEPLTALAIRQTVQANAPSLNNAVMLGRLATRIAVKEDDATRKQAYLTMAEDAFKQAQKIDPDSKLMLSSFAEYYRITGQDDKARELLIKSEDDRLLWRHYYRVGRHEEAKQLLEQLYTDPANRGDALKGLVLVAEASGDKTGVERYSQELISLEDNIINRLAQIRAYLDVGLVQGAERKLQSLKERYPDEPRLLLMEALLAKRQGQLDRAMEMVNRHLERHQEDAGAWRLRGEIDLLLEQGDQAIQDFRKSRLLEDDPSTTIALAKAYVWVGRDDDAISTLRQLTDQGDIAGPARVFLEQIYRRLGRYDALAQLYAEALTRSPENTGWLLRAGALAFERGRYDEAVGFYDRARRAGQPPSRPYVAALDGYLHALIASAGERIGGSVGWHPDRLEKVFQDGARHLNSEYAPIVLYRLAEARQKLGDQAAAEDYCRQALDHAWEDEDLSGEILERTCLLVGNDVMAQYCRGRLQGNPDSVTANAIMARLSQIRNDYDGAVDYIDKCIDLAGPDTPEATKHLLKKAHVLTLAYKATSDTRYLDRAIAVYESLAARMPNNTSILNNLAYMLAQDDRQLEVAERYARRVVAEAPDNAIYLDTFAYILYKAGKPAEAAQAMTAALQQYELRGAVPTDVYEHLGMIKEALDEPKNALAAYRRALEVGGDSLSEAAKERITEAVKRLE